MSPGHHLYGEASGLACESPVPGPGDASDLPEEPRTDIWCGAHQAARTVIPREHLPAHPHPHQREREQRLLGPGTPYLFPLCSSPLVLTRKILHLHHLQGLLLALVMGFSSTGPNKGQHQDLVLGNTFYFQLWEQLQLEKGVGMALTHSPLAMVNDRPAPRRK